MEWISVKDRFYANVFPEPNTGCWLWGGRFFKSGYGILKIKDKSYRAHRASWMIHNQNIEIIQLVLHKCDVPACVNPDHLYIGDQKQNAKDRDLRGRNGFLKRTHCKNGHPLSVENVYVYKGKRLCRICRRTTRTP